MSKIKEFFNDIRSLNKKYKCMPLIIFAIIYVASPIDLLPELFFRSWLFYLDDVAVLIFAFVITYMEVFLNERNRNDNENVEGVYSAVRRNTVELGSRGDMVGDGNNGCNDIYGLLINQIPSPELPAAGNTKPESEIVRTEPEFISAELSTAEQSSENNSSFFERQFIENVSVSTSADFVQQLSETTRPESFIFDEGNTIVW